MDSQTGLLDPYEVKEKIMLETLVYTSECTCWGYCDCKNITITKPYDYEKKKNYDSQS